MADAASNHPGAPASSATDQRVSTLTGDRLCTKCTYNLVGQPVYRERHYSMLIVRCPECACVAALQEYPKLGRWADRWAFVVAALWFAFLLSLFVGTVIIMIAGSRYFAQSGAYDLALLIAKDNAAWRAQQPQSANTAKPQRRQSVQDRILVRQPLDPQYVDQLDTRSFIAHHGGTLRVTRLAVTEESVIVGVSLFGLGCIWALCLARRRMLMHLLFALIPLGLAVTLEAVFQLSEGNSPLGSVFTRPLDFASDLMWVPLIACAYIVMAILLASGLVAGKPIARLLIRSLLPPHMQSVFARLWLVDGIKPPPTLGRTGH